MALGENNLSSNEKIPFPLAKFRTWISSSAVAEGGIVRAAYFLCAVAGTYLSPARGAIVTFWLPAGLFLAVLLLNPTRDWPWLALAVLPANFVFDLLYGTRFVVILFSFARTRFRP